MPSCVESSRSPMLAFVCYSRSDDVGDFSVAELQDTIAGMEEAARKLPTDDASVSAVSLGALRFPKTTLQGLNRWFCRE